MITSFAYGLKAEAGTLFRANSGGSQYTSTTTGTWNTDANYSGGTTYKFTSAIDNTTDDTLYQSERYGAMTYSVPLTNGSYTLNLYFAENHFNAAGLRKFDVKAEGIQILDDFDIYASAGGQNKAIVKSFPVTVSDGKLDVNFINVISNAKISAIEVVSASTTTAPSFRANVGGSQYSSATTGTWNADSGYSGGNTTTWTAAVDNTTDDVLYQSERYGNFSYAAPVANGTYTLNLYFAENYWTAAGQRKFDVKAEGIQILDDFDIYASAGGKNKAIVKSFPVTISDGKLDVTFTTVVNDSKVSAIELVPTTAATTPPPPAPDPVPPPTSTGLTFSSGLSAYTYVPTSSATDIYYRTVTNPSSVPSNVASIRQAVVSFYLANGFDLSYWGNYQPSGWTTQTAGNPYTSADSSLTKQIPSTQPKYLLPKGYFSTSGSSGGAISTLGPPGDGSDNFGIGLVVAEASDPLRALFPEDYPPSGFDIQTTCPVRTGNDMYQIRIPDDTNFRVYGVPYGDLDTWKIPANSFDRAVIFIDKGQNKFTESWISMEGCNADVGKFGTKYGTGLNTVPVMGDRGGVAATQMGGVAGMILPDEITTAIANNTALPHAIRGPHNKCWKAVVYPAKNVDSTCDGSYDSFESAQIPYGALVQLDPNLNADNLAVSAAARVIIKTIQQYGWYMDDTGVRAMDVKSTVSNQEIAAYGGGYGIMSEVLGVVNANNIYLVAPLVKK